MGITRAQYLMGNNTQAAVLPGQVQAVTAGYGITIDTNGVISVDPNTLRGVIVNVGLLQPFAGTDQTFDMVYYGTTTPFTPSPPENIAVFLGGVPQLPGVAYTILGSRITFSDPPPVGTVFLGISTDII